MLPNPRFFTGWKSPPSCAISAIGCGELVYEWLPPDLFRSMRYGCQKGFGFLERSDAFYMIFVNLFGL